MSRRIIDSSHALVGAPLTAVRATPDVRAEQVSQEVLGSVLQIVEASEGWARVRGEDDYEGWVSLGSLVPCGADDAKAWRDGDRGPTTLTLDATVVDGSQEMVIRLPWGARVAIVGDDALLPDGRRVRLSSGSWIREDELAARFPPHAASVSATAREWLGVPYLWGGRTRWGADCSGFVQAVYRLHGCKLARDSREQAECGTLVDPGRDFEALQPADLIFFRARDSERVVHVAFSLGGAEILHAAEGNGQVAVNNLNGESELERSLAARAARAAGARRLLE